MEKRGDYLKAYVVQSDKCKKWYLVNRTYFHPDESDHFYKGSSSTE